jgi:hypothetical protein
MVGHHLKRIQDQRPEPLRQGIPDSLNNAPLLAQFHFTLNDLPEKEIPALGADGNEIRATTGVVVSAQTNGPSMMYARIVGHISRSLVAHPRCRGTACCPLFIGPLARRRS